MSRIGVALQEPASRTILGFLRDQMDGADDTGARRRSLKDRLGFRAIACCGATWRFGPTTDESDDGEGREEEERRVADPIPVCSDPDPDPSSEPPATPGMNLAAALAAERQLREVPATPSRVSLMRLLEETDGRDEATWRERSGRRWGSEGSDSVCCVCMGRKKGAAFIPCGHTFCRVCSRELWLNRGTCPLCNRPILEILDIF